MLKEERVTKVEKPFSMSHQETLVHRQLNHSKAEKKFLRPNIIILSVCLAQEKTMNILFFYKDELTCLTSNVK